MKPRRKQLHPVKASNVVKTLEKLGFVARRAKGSHVFLKHQDGRTTTIPIHPGEELDRHLIRKIAVDVGMDSEEFMYLVDEG